MNTRTQILPMETSSNRHVLKINEVTGNTSSLGAGRWQMFSATLTSLNPRVCLVWIASGHRFCFMYMPWLNFVDPAVYVDGVRHVYLVGIDVDLWKRRRGQWPPLAASFLDAEEPRRRRRRRRRACLLHQVHFFIAIRDGDLIELIKLITCCLFFLRIKL